MGCSLILAICLVPGLAVADSKVCSVTGKSVKLYEVTVSPRGEEPFEIGLYETPVSATLPAKCGAPLTLHTLGSIELTAKRDDMWLRVSREVMSADGLVTLMPGTQVIDACVVDGGVRVSAIIFGGDVHDGELKRPEQYVRDVEVPCDALTLDPVAHSGPISNRGKDGTKHRWKMRGDANRVRLHRAPSTRSAGRVLEGPSSLREISTKKGWVYVETANEGVNARGWVATSQLERIPDTTGTGYTYGCYGHSVGTYGESGYQNHIVKAGVVRADTRVYTGPGGVEWGRFASPTHIKVRFERNATWAEVLYVPGLSGARPSAPFHNGWVPLDTVTLDP